MAASLAPPGSAAIVLDKSGVVSALMLNILLLTRYLQYNQSIPGISLAH